MGPSPTQRLLNNTLQFANSVDPVNQQNELYTFGITFTPLTGVFGGACEKYIPLFVIEGLEICIQLDNIKDVPKCQFVPWPRQGADHNVSDLNLLNF